MFIVSLILAWLPWLFILGRKVLAKAYCRAQKNNEAENNLESLLIINTVIMEMETVGRYFLWYASAGTVLILIIKFV